MSASACGRDTAEQHGHPVLDLQTREDVVAEARLADRRRQRGGADHPDGGRAHARHQHRRRERQLDARETLPIRHADAARRFDHGRVEIQDAGDAVANDRQHRIEREREQRRQEAERGEARAEDALRQTPRARATTDRTARAARGPGSSARRSRTRAPASERGRFAPPRSPAARLRASPSAIAAALSKTCCAQVLREQLPCGGPPVVQTPAPSSSAATRSAWRRGMSMQRAHAVVRMARS